MEKEREEKGKKREGKNTTNTTKGYDYNAT